MTSPPTSRIVIADDHEAIRRGVRHVVERHDRVVVGEAANGEEAVTLVQNLQPDLLILDFRIPVMNGVQVCRKISSMASKTEILLYTMHDNEEMQIEALRAGARGYVLKSDPSDTLRSAVDALLRHKAFFTPSVSQVLLDSFLKNKEHPKSAITEREQGVLQLIAEGFTNQAVADQLGISVKTVETHRSALKAKLSLHTTADLVRYAIRNGIVEA